MVRPFSTQTHAHIAEICPDSPTYKAMVVTQRIVNAAADLLLNRRSPLIWRSIIKKGEHPGNGH